MTMPRNLLVDVKVTRYYHCVSRTVRQTHLLSSKFPRRKQWLEKRLELLANHFAASICGYAIMDNHLHVLVRLDPERAKDWSPEDVIRHWLAVYPPKSLDRDDPQQVEKWVKQQAKDHQRVEVLRQRLQNLGWLMKALKEPLARLANEEDQCTGAFWEGRYKSIAILDEESLLATCAYIDLNPFAAGLSKTPEESRHTSLRQRLNHAKRMGKLEAVKEAAKGALAGSRAMGRLEDRHWLCPLDDGRRRGSEREGMLEGFSLGSYLGLLDYTARLRREGKAALPAEVPSIFERLGTSVESWESRMRAMLSRERLLGSHFSSSRAKLRQLAERKGCHHLDNVVPIPASS